MKILTWNKKCLIKRRILLINAAIVMLQETKLDLQQAESFGCGLGSQYIGSKQVAVPAEGVSGGLQIIWKPSLIQIEKIDSNRNWLLVSVKLLSFNISFLLINVYGPISSASKRAFWADLDSVISLNQNQHIFFGGDFNSIRSLKDKRGGITRLGRPHQDFND